MGVRVNMGKAASKRPGWWRGTRRTLLQAPKETPGAHYKFPVKSRVGCRASAGGHSGTGVGYY